MRISTCSSPVVLLRKWRRGCEVSRGLPVSSGQVNSAIRRLKARGNLVPACYGVADADDEPACDVTEWPDRAELDQNGALRGAAKRKASLKQDVGPRLRGRPGLRVAITVGILCAQRGDLVWGEEHDHRLRGIEGGIQDLADVGRRCPRHADRL